MPARAGALFGADGVETEAGDLDEGVPGVGVDGDPLAGTGRAPAHQVAGGERPRDQAAAEEGEADRPGAVVGVVVEGGVAAAPYIGAADDRVGGVDRALDSFRCPRRRERDAGEEDRGRAGVGTASPVGEDLGAADARGAVRDVRAVAAGRGGRQRRRVGGDFLGARQLHLLRRRLGAAGRGGFYLLAGLDHRQAPAQRGHRVIPAADAEQGDRHLEDCCRGPHPLQDYAGVKLLLVPLAIVAFVLFLLVLGAIGLAMAFAVIYVVGGAWRLVSGGRRRER